MSQLPKQHEYRTELLSAREQEVLDLAVEGRTDEQIAQALGLTTSTVASYWVRIRGKVGALSRTEIVGMVLRQAAVRRERGLHAENDVLRSAEQRAQTDLSQTQSDLAQSQSDLRAMRGAAWHLLALDHIPLALAVCRPPGQIVYANRQAQHTFAAEPGELDDMLLWNLTIPEDRPGRKAALAGYFAPDGPARVVVGIERPYYALRCDGTNFRCVLITERFEGPEGTMSVVTFSEAFQEAETLLKALRQPFVVQ